MRTLLLLVAGAVIGAAGFHAYYSGLAAPSRCAWDHPLDGRARAACQRLASAHGYDAAGRAALDRLIENVAR